MLKHGDVSLRAVRNADAHILYEAINSPSLVRFNAPFKPVHESCHLEWLSGVLSDKTKEVFIIEHSEVSVGCIQLIDINSIHRSAELTMRIFDESCRGKGIGRSAVSLLCEHAFCDLGLVRVWLRVFSENERAIHAYKKAEFSVEGVMKKAAFIKGAFVDVVVMARLSDDKL
ncbi:MAG: GNAT family N-acetyltransferase [Alphaproteobacteria bacterium]